ncbi:MAG TPA: imidazolonepropionase [Mycobacteriales bacterium]|nr:imidazolonepropionase [Mycobacteriales bacterium]
MTDLVVRHIGRLTTWHAPVVPDAAVVVREGRVAWTGADTDLPAGLDDLPELDADGAAVLPGFVDCHTHAVWAGSRREDFAGRLSGDGYRPGGIATTVAATRAASYDVLLDDAVARVRTMQSHGTTTVEMKSGYGLTPDDECRLLDVIRDVAATQPIAVEPTFLGAHVVPPEADRTSYVDEVVESIPAAQAHGASWCDVFCDEGAFTVDESRRILTAAQAHGLGLRIHAEQIAHTGAAELAAELHCASADHLEHVDEAGARALAAAGVVAVLVPVVSLYTRSGDWAHAATLRAAGCEIAIATDCNPGSAWCESMPYAVQLACLAMGLPVEEALRAATLGGAKALRLPDAGHLGVGARGDLVLLDAEHEVDLVAHLGVNPVARTVVAGRPIG